MDAHIQATMKHHDCCYANCPRPGTIHVGENGNRDTQWICRFHRDRWNADRARFIADGLLCEMEELPMTANEQNPATQPPFWTARAPHPGPDYPSDRGRTVYVDEIRILASTLGCIAGGKGANRADAIERYPKSVREQFPGRAVYRVRPIPEGEVPKFIFMVALVCYQPTSDTTADLFELVVSWLSDDLDSNLPELIEREIRDIEWDWIVGRTAVLRR
jgi:hypothetical protein